MSAAFRTNRDDLIAQGVGWTTAEWLDAFAADLHEEVQHLRGLLRTARDLALTPEGMAGFDAWLDDALDAINDDGDAA